MDDSEQNKTVNKKDPELEVHDISQLDGTGAAPGMSSQSTPGPIDLTTPNTESLQNTEPSQPQKKKYWLVALVTVLVLGIIGGDSVVCDCEQWE